jgi:zinc and cadmium transporter
MSLFSQLLIFSTIGSIFSLAGGIILLQNKKAAKNLGHYGAPFAAGTLLAAAFLDLLPESGSQGLNFALVGILTFFLLERFLSWFHHHHPHSKSEHHDPKVSMIIIGDTLHNFIDGLAIGAAFLVSPQAGIVASLAVAAHEIPQEIGDFSLLLSKGMARKKVLFVNLISACAAILSAVLIFQFGSNIKLNTNPILGLVAGMFIYIAVSDIIPEIHKKTSPKEVNISATLLIIGALSVAIFTRFLH